MTLNKIPLAKSYAEKAKAQIDTFMRTDISNITPAHLPIILSWLTGKSMGVVASKLSIIKYKEPNITTEKLLEKFYQIL